MLKLTNTDFQFDISSFEKIMDITVMNGGAKWQHTIYQILFDPKSLNLYLQTKGQKGWTNISLQELFAGNLFYTRSSIIA